MDVGTGYFGRIHLATESLVSVPFVRALTALASDYSGPVAASEPFASFEQMSSDLQAVPVSEDDFWGIGLLNSTFDLEDWSTFSRTSPMDPILADTEVAS
jgi:hypothetical protein